MPIATRSSSRVTTRSTSHKTTRGHVAKKSKQTIKKTRIVITKTQDEFIVDTPIGELVNIYSTQVWKFVLKFSFLKINMLKQNRIKMWL